MIDLLKDGKVIPEASFVRLQSGIFSEDEEEGEGEEGEDEGDEEEEPQEKDSDEKDGEIEEEEGEEEQEGDDQVEAPAPNHEEDCAPAKTAKKSICMPAPPPPKHKQHKKSSAETAFPEIHPNPDAAGSGRSPAQMELAQALYHIERLEKKHNLLLDMKPFMDVKDQPQF